MQTTINTSKIGISFLILIYGLAAMMFFSSCASVRQQERSGCYVSKSMVGYGNGFYKNASKTTKR